MSPQLQRQEFLGCFAEPLQRTGSHLIAIDAEMQMWSVGPARLANHSYLLSAFYFLTGFDQDLLHVDVERNHTLAMINCHHIAVQFKNAATLSQYHRPWCGGINRTALKSGEIQAGMEVIGQELTVDYASYAEWSRCPGFGRPDEIARPVTHW